MNDVYSRILTLDWLIDGLIFSVFAFIASNYYKVALKVALKAPFIIIKKLVARRNRKIEKILNDDVLLYSEISFRNTLIGSFICAFFVFMIATGMLMIYCYINLSITFYFENEFLNMISRFILVLILILEVFTMVQYNFVRELKNKRNKRNIVKY